MLKNMKKIVSADIISEIVSSNSNIESLSFSKFNFSQPFQERIDMSFGANQLLIENALKLRMQSSLPFWDCVMASTFTLPEISDDVFAEALVHTDNIHVFTVKGDSIAQIADIIEKSEDNLAVNSFLECKNSIRYHLCLLDFHIPFSKKSTDIVKKILSAVEISGYILCSGKSYHFYGDQILNQEDYFELLTKLLLISPVIDKQWIAHQLLRKRAFLRVTKKYDEYPYLVERI